MHITLYLLPPVASMAFSGIRVAAELSLNATVLPSVVMRSSTMSCGCVESVTVGSVYVVFALGAWVYIMPSCRETAEVDAAMAITPAFFVNVKSNSYVSVL